MFVHSISIYEYISKEAVVLPKFSKDQKSKSGSGRNRNLSGGNSGLKKRKKEQQDRQDLQDEEVIIGITDPDEEQEEQSPEVEEVSQSTVLPFSDGIVASCFENLAVVPRVGGGEVELLRGFLEYFATTESYIGSITNKLSFMKKQGGRLL